MTLLTLRDIADTFGVSKQNIHRRAQRLGLGRFIGNALMFTAAEAERLRPPSAGGADPRRRRRRRAARL